MIWNFARRPPYVLLVTVTMVGIVALTVTLVLLFTSSGTVASSNDAAIGVKPIDAERVRGAAVTNGHECAEIAVEILRRGGSAVDAAVAAQLCEGIAMPQSTGLGGGFLMTIYSKSSGRVETLNARETAPLTADRDMFQGDPNLSCRGGLSVAVPGELKGLWAAHQRYGKLPWADVVRPAIDLCFNGHLVTPFLARFLKSQEAKLIRSPTLREIFINPKTNRTYVEGDRIVRRRLGETLEIVATDGADALYNGQLTEPFVADIEEMNGIITAEDLKRYEPIWMDPITVPLSNNSTLYTSPLPGSGAILAFILNILHGFLDRTQPETVSNYQRIVESFKYAYGRRTELADPNYVAGMDDLLANLTSPHYASEIRQLISDYVTYDDPAHYGANTTLTDDHGTAHISILSPDGDAVSVTGTINLYFGAYIRSRSTGIILNDEMDDFSAPNITNAFGIPPSPSNYIEPGKRPISSMCPSVVVDDVTGDVKLILGAAGGSKITTTVALVTMRHLLFEYPLRTAVEAKRLHHQLFPMAVQVEKGFDEDILMGLENIGHNYTISSDGGFAALTAITTANGTIEADFDSRRCGSIAYL